MSENLYFNGRRIEEILEIPFQFRGEIQNLEIVDLTYSVKFFSKLREKHSDILHQQCCRYMTIEKYSKNQYIYEIGDIANKYYILLKGKVSIVKQLNTENDDLQLSDDSEGDYIEYMPRNIRSRSRRIDIKPELFLEFSQGIKERKQNDMINITNIEEENRNLLEFIMQGHENEENEREIKIMSPGHDFGQEALLSNKARTFNAIAKSRVVVAVLTKVNFKRIINEISKQKCFIMLDFLKSVSIFSK